MDIFVARQPVFDQKNKVAGYTLLFKDGVECTLGDKAGDTAAITMLSHSFFSFDIRDLLGGKPGFIRFTPEMIMENIPLLFPAGLVHIEIPGETAPAPDLLNAIAGLRKKGYQIVLNAPASPELISHSDIVKIDIGKTAPAGIFDRIRRLKEKNGPALMADHVETREDYHRACEMGFTLFQGYFFSKPETVTGKEISANQAAKMQLIAQLRQEDLNISKIQELIKKDPGTSFKLLKFINSAYFRRPVPIDTIKDAVIFLGRDELKKFITIIAVGDLNPAASHELLRRSVVRAVMCEKTGQIMQTQFSDDELFTLGMFTLMDALMNCKMEVIAENIRFSDNMTDALMGRIRQFNLMLHIIDCFERGLWESNVLTAVTGRTMGTRLPAYYLDAVKMADSFFETAVS
ncbi:MAG: HDOD domain-containing protein [Desulfobacter sp.]|nr:MAG: HDOD domain-containing protein [Desulfobacter sp.]